MPRPATPRPPGEHLTTLARILKQVSVDEKMQKERQKRLKKFLSQAMQELQAEMSR